MPCHPTVEFRMIDIGIYERLDDGLLFAGVSVCILRIHASWTFERNSRPSTFIDP